MNNMQPPYSNSTPQMLVDHVNTALLAGIVNQLPFPVLLFAADGTLVMTNQAMLQDRYMPVPPLLVGRYNVLEEPFILHAGILPDIKRAFRGETVFLSDIHVPLAEIADRFSMPHSDLESLYQDITLFPVYCAVKKECCVAAMLINKSVYFGKREIARAQRWIENHCVERFDLDALARATGLSKAHFCRLFKRQTGLTAHDYFISCKVNLIKEKLMDKNITIAQAFAACGADYSGHYARVFKNKTGFSPSHYRSREQQALKQPRPMQQAGY